ncbi:MAP3K delta1 protein kinase-like, putative [Acanthamoeba castellanii str. Neff]|uniref:MAP3K delta1 protein kinase-like, putative n=1 Tax=Acanthamoeba castellanii (strain ATCC 30010 / Neff) TaxID=1257118 RepID=L8HJ67_ACACF|nr:MAP3K delta1 protein kinase-like, putative [Acanthamoeba castellanii str. Neff]ELR24451.1 MAP3K delta1 protein kinase-like, putative [Acanthamoeba castellanii str. Neff]
MAGLLGNSTGYNGYCTNVQELVRLLSWAMVNERAAVLASTDFYQLTIVREEWHVDWSEIELGEAIGMGGYGEVYRGTEVAVKLANTQTTKDRQRNFAEEVLMLRHPNVVLFMAASTKPPKVCIVWSSRPLVPSVR